MANDESQDRENGITLKQPKQHATHRVSRAKYQRKTGTFDRTTTMKFMTMKNLTIKKNVRALASDEIHFIKMY